MTSTRIFLTYYPSQVLTQRSISREIPVRTRLLQPIIHSGLSQTLTFVGDYYEFLNVAREAFKTFLGCPRRGMTRPFFPRLPCCSSCVAFVSRNWKVCAIFDISLETFLTIVAEIPVHSYISPVYLGQSIQDHPNILTAFLYVIIFRGNEASCTSATVLNDSKSSSDSQ